MTHRKQAPAPGRTSPARVGASPRSAHPPHPERLWASNGFDRFQPRRASRAAIVAFYVFYALALAVCFAVGLWVLTG